MLRANSPEIAAIIASMSVWKWGDSALLLGLEKIKKQNPASVNRVQKLTQSRSVILSLG